MWPELELMVQLCTGLGALAQGGTLYLRREQAPLYKRFGVTLFLVGVVFVGKAHWGWSGGAGPLAVAVGHAYTLVMTLIPLSLALLVEGALQRHLHLAPKLLWLLGTVALAGTSLGPWSETSGWWELVFQGYFALTVVILLGYLLLGWWHQRPGPRRSLYAGLLLTGLLAPVFVFTDSADIVGWQLPQLAAVPVLLLTYSSCYSLSAVGQWRLHRALRDLAGIALSAAAVIACAAYVLPLSLSDKAALMVLAVVGFMSAQPLLTGWIMRRDRRADVLFDRLSGLPLASQAAFLAGLQGWPELRQVTLADLSAFTEAEREGLRRYLEVSGGVAGRRAVQEALILGPAPGQARALEQALFLLEQHEVDHLVSLGDAAELLGVSVEYGLDPAVYQRVLGVIALLASTLPPREVADG